MKQITGAVALAFGLSALIVPAAEAEPGPEPEVVSTSVETSTVPEQVRGNRCATRREFRRVKVSGKLRHRSSIRRVRRIMDFNGKRQPHSLVYSGGHRWVTRMYRHCGARRPFKADDFVYVKFRDNRAYAKDGKP